MRGSTIKRNVLRCFDGSLIGAFKAIGLLDQFNREPKRWPAMLKQQNAA